MNIDHLIRRIKNTVDSHRIEEGAYSRWIWQNDAKNRKLGLNEYGCADAANILYTIQEFITEPQKREKWIQTLQSLQDKETGLFREETHHVIHTTAHCTAALELFDAKPKYPLTALKQYTTKEGLYDLLEHLKWGDSPWNNSHQGAGIYAALTLTDSVSPEWENWYFDWLKQEADPETGMWRKGFVTNGNAPLFHQMGGTFHYIFNHEYAKKPLVYPERLIDTCISLYEERKIGVRKGEGYLAKKFGQYIGFLEVDWVYSINRASRQTPHRFSDCKTVLRKFAKDYIEFLSSVDHQTHDGFNDLHMLFGTTCALAELQTALPGEISTKKPLRLVLDRRPFI